jgi:hypothetical protein
MNQKLLALYGLKFSPFSQEVPTEALYLSPKIENFCWRIEQAHLREGGWALIHGYEKESVMERRSPMLLIRFTSMLGDLLIIARGFISCRAMTGAADLASNEGAFPVLPSHRSFREPCASCRDWHARNGS